jgi:hypothetical protein
MRYSIISGINKAIPHIDHRTYTIKRENQRYGSKETKIYTFELDN